MELLGRPCQHRPASAGDGRKNLRRVFEMTHACCALVFVECPPVDLVLNHALAGLPHGVLDVNVHQNMRSGRHEFARDEGSHLDVRPEYLKEPREFLSTGYRGVPWNFGAASIEFPCHRFGNMLQYTGDVTTPEGFVHLLDGRNI